MLDFNKIQSIADGALVIDGELGDVQTSGGYRYDLPRTFTHAMTPERFIPASSDETQWLLASDPIPYRFPTASPGLRSASATPENEQIPAGAPLMVEIDWATSSGSATALRFYGCAVKYTVDRVSPT